MATKKDDNEQYTFNYEPIRGFPELRWTGKRPFKGTMYFPAQLKETHGDTVDGWRNKIYWGDNLQVMSHMLREYRGKVKLVYIDPPYDSKAEYKKKIELRNSKTTSDISSFEDKQYTDIWSNDEYLQFIYERLILIRELLSDDGSIFFHVDWHKVHHLRAILDEVFGYKNFMNEIIWHYRKWSVKCKNFQRNHDDILWYIKSDSGERIFNIVETQEPSEGTMKRWKGQKQKAIFDVNGNRLATSEEEESEGAPLADVWYISIINPAAIERTEYPTQKPEDLLKRIIRHCTNEGDLVFDCFMGSGTTQAVATKLGRRYLGADINLGAVQTTTKRLLGIADELKGNHTELGFDETKPSKIYSGFEVYTVNHYDFFRNELEARDLLIQALEIQKLPGNMLWDGELDGWKVKILAVNRLATAADLNAVLNNLDFKGWEKKTKENPGAPVEKIKFVCMGHDPDLRAQFLKEMEKYGFKVDVEIVDILRDKQELQFKRDSEAKIKRIKKTLEVQKFYPMNLLQKLSLEKAKVGDWRELVDSILIDWNYDGAVFTPTLADIPDKKELVKGAYDIPSDAGTIRVKITDLLSESWEGNVEE